MVLLWSGLRVVFCVEERLGGCRKGVWSLVCGVCMVSVSLCGRGT